MINGHEESPHLGNDINNKKVYDLCCWRPFVKLCQRKRRYRETNKKEKKLFWSFNRSSAAPVSDGSVYDGKALVNDE